MRPVRSSSPALTHQKHPSRAGKKGQLGLVMLLQSSFEATSFTSTAPYTVLNLVEDEVMRKDATSILKAWLVLA